MVFTYPTYHIMILLEKNTIFCHHGAHLIPPISVSGRSFFETTGGGKASRAACKAILRSLKKHADFHQFEKFFQQVNGKGEF